MPYYEDGTAKIYLGDCREVLADLRPSVDTLVTDPPYASAAATVTSGYGKSIHGGNWSDMSLVSLMIESTLANVTCGEAYIFSDHLGYAAVLPVLFRRFITVQSIIWDKDTLGMGSYYRKQTEFITYARQPVGGIAAPEFANRSQRDLIRLRPPRRQHHPSEKPVELMTMLLAPSGGQTILDPYMGGGTTLIAARRLGRRSIGIEMEERYCEVAANRLAQEALDFGVVA